MQFSTHVEMLLTGENEIEITTHILTLKSSSSAHCSLLLSHIASFTGEREEIHAACG